MTGSSITPAEQELRNTNVLEAGWLTRQVQNAVEGRKDRPEWLKRIEQQNAESHRRLAELAAKAS